VYLMPSFSRYELACEVLEVLSAEERGWTPPSSRLCE
jgi:hypothetical protein